jgi:heptosyltransferase-2
MNILIMKLGASGDVIRTTPLLRVLPGEIHWLTDDRNAALLSGVEQIALTIPWSKRDVLNGKRYDLVLNLEDSAPAAQVLQQLTFDELFGAYLDDSDTLTYTENSQPWFDLSLISRFGKERADQLKLKNRTTYQEMIFQGLGYSFKGERYLLPRPIPTDLAGDIAFAPNSGPVWPMKNWAYYDGLKCRFEQQGLVVNTLPTRASILEHLGDIQNHRYLVSGDSLPMHMAMGSGIKCASIFICTSPWEIYGYGLQRQIVSPALTDYFYRRDFDHKATESISLDDVYHEVSCHMANREAHVEPSRSLERRNTGDDQP